MSREIKVGFDYRSADTGRIPSPALLFFRHAVERNIDLAVSIAGSPDRLRPHIKTHKTSEIVGMKLSRGITRFKCATIAEAGMLGSCGAPDVLIAYQMVGPNADRLTALIRNFPGTRFSSLIDHPAALSALSKAAAAAGVTVGVFLDLDVADHRTGLRPDDTAAGLYAAACAAPGIEVRGIHAYDGSHSEPDPGSREALARETYGTVERLAETIGGAGHPVPSIVMSGTPMFPFYAPYERLELSPGTCILQDYDHMRDYPDMGFLPAAMVLSRVISLPGPGRFTLDAGAKALCTDRPVRGAVLGIGECTPGKVSEEHWQFSAPEHGVPEIGTAVYIIPAHVCTTVEHYDSAWVIGPGGEIEGNWRISARGRDVSLPYP